ncbi:porin OmpC [Yersinia enterocolitica]|uniref:porin OmpC n=1 Tax=Yersinia enterocolitica TaxID=630 RepID=UPI0005FCEA7F|nr:porin OmpC [Yersinia enterocolitica]EKN3501415.1 porin OmpC [Yersinia enterocolitica]EKN3846379.1 porin OmpC [Yersinia enterocolitica]EKN3887307.1 porin OmpC [Yersinia enterocolitica]EKN3945329.1 porin OmpC [Yersinia enterocolitica]EKN3969728.1 porin OmpC [Yersinia enterocolitica]
MKINAVVILGLIVTSTYFPSVNAAEIYNSDGNKLDLYGRFDAMHWFSGDNGIDGDQSYLRFGFKGETQINTQLIGYGQWEYQANLNRPESEDNKNFTRVGFAGLKLQDYGSIDYGRNYGVLYDVAAWTDVMPEFGGNTYGADNFMFQRANGLLTYRNNDFFGVNDDLKFSLQYINSNGGPSETNNGRDVLAQNGDGYGMSIAYDIGAGVSISGAFFNVKRTDEQNGANNKDIIGRGSNAEAYSVGLKYDDNSYYAAIIYTQAYNATRFGNVDSAAYGFADKSQNIEAVIQYGFDSGFRPSLGYQQSRGTQIDGYGDQDIYKDINIGVFYYFNSNMYAYADYQINLLHNNNFTRDAHIATDNMVAVALNYQF